MMKRKKTLTALFVTSVFVMLLSSGCYTKFYRPGMEMDGPFSSNELYNRYDSSAIDTTLTREDYIQDYYPESGGWYDWGSYRNYPRTRWGFDFYNFSPGYYHSYYGYYDYYGSPWWSRNGYGNNNWWYRGGGHGGYNTSPGEPPSQRDGRRPRDSYNGGAPSTTTPGGYTGGGGTVTTTPAPQTKPAPPPNNKKSDTSDSGSSQKRAGKRRN